MAARLQGHTAWVGAGHVGFELHGGEEVFEGVVAQVAAGVQSQGG
jgi:hypothetical protein